MQRNIRLAINVLQIILNLLIAFLILRKWHLEKND